MNTSFADLNLNKQLLNAIEEIGIKEPTAIQEKAFSPIMAGKDVIGISQTGTGKTFAYLLPVFRLWKFQKIATPRILIIVPTRELVVQVVEEAEKLAAYLNIKIVGVYGGANMRPQKMALAEGADLVVGTPGRLVDHIEHGALRTKQIRQVVIDEVDEMLNLGFRTQLRKLSDLLPSKRQHILFSATMTEEVELVINEFSTYYEKIEAAPSGAPLENIQQVGYEIPNFNSKVNLLEALLKADADMSKVLVFARSKKFADALHERLDLVFEEAVGVIHSSKSQNFRFRMVNEFDAGTCRCLIATDIIARGLDVSNVTHVVNFDLTDTAEKYIHRIGRTGRSEKKGIAISFVSEEDKTYQQDIEALMDQQITMLDLPADIELSEELIQLEQVNEIEPFNVHKTKKVEPSGPAFHEKKAKNRKVNKKVRIVELKKLKYGKPIKRGAKGNKGKKK